MKKTVNLVVLFCGIFIFGGVLILVGAVILGGGAGCANKEPVAPSALNENIKADFKPAVDQPCVGSYPVTACNTVYEIPCGCQYSSNCPITAIGCTTPVPTATPETTLTPIPTNTPESTPTPVPTNTPEPTPTPIPTNTPIPPIPTNTPSPLAKCIGDAAEHFKESMDLCGDLKYTDAYDICVVDALHTLQSDLAGCIPTST